MENLTAAVATTASSQPQPMVSAVKLLPKDFATASSSSLSLPQPQQTAPSITVMAPLSAVAAGPQHIRIVDHLGRPIGGDQVVQICGLANQPAAGGATNLILQQAAATLAAQHPAITVAASVASSTRAIQLSTNWEPKPLQPIRPRPESTSQDGGDDGDGMDAAADLIINSDCDAAENTGTATAEISFANARPLGGEDFGAIGAIEEDIGSPGDGQSCSSADYMHASDLISHEQLHDHQLRSLQLQSSGVKILNLASDLDAEFPPLPDMGLEEAAAAIGCDDSPSFSSGGSNSNRDASEMIAHEKLQRFVNARIAQLDGYSIETAEVAARCKQILTMYNIGQRLFAKCILNQSQGAVSEILSKPKPWHRLTEKGRDSFRKIYAFVMHDQAIDVLRSLSPKRFFPGPQPGRPMSQTNGNEDKMTEAKISAILSAAHSQIQQAQKIRVSIEDSANARDSPETSGSPSGLRTTNGELPGSGPPPRASTSMGYSSITTPSSTSVPGGGSQTPRARSYRYRHDDIPKEMITAIYERELAIIKAQERSVAQIQRNMKGAPQSDAIGAAPGLTRNSRWYSPGFGRGRGKSLNGGGPPSSSGEESQSWEPHEAQVGTSNPGLAQTSVKNSITEFLQNEIQRHAELAANDSGHEAAPPAAAIGAGGGGPLAIFDSPISSAGSSTTYSPSSSNFRPLKAVLPPVTQEQFEQYAYLDTDLIVRQVKDFLCQYSISQRSFGEAVLGLSQGSVSDLLARPKPWSMLTQKGREPFIRMQVFLDSPQEVQKLTATRSPYINPAVITGSSPGGPVSMVESVSVTSDVIGSAISTSQPIIVHQIVDPPPVVMTPPKRSERNDWKGKLDAILSLNGADGLPTPDYVPVMPPSPPISVAPRERVHNLAGTLEPLDTHQLAEEMKHELIKLNIAQKLFGKAVLGLSQGSVSELLSRPKPWHLLSTKGREPFVRMHLWLKDPERLQKLEDYREKEKNEKPQKRSYQNVTPTAVDLIPRETDYDFVYKRSRLVASTAMTEPFKAAVSTPTTTILSPEQRDVLTDAFAQESHPGQATMFRLASQLGLSLKVVANWFKQQPAASSADAIKREPGERIELTTSRRAVTGGAPGDWRAQLLAAVEGLTEDQEGQSNDAVSNDSSDGQRDAANLSTGKVKAEPQDCSPVVPTSTVLEENLKRLAADSLENSDCEF